MMEAPNTMGRVLQESLVQQEKNPVRQLESEVKDVLTQGWVMYLAVEEPPHRQQAHDDEAPVIIRPYVIGTQVALCDPETWNGRGKLIGAVLQHGEDFWILVAPERSHEGSFMDDLRRACHREGPEGYSEFWLGLPPEERKNWKEPSRAFPKYFARKTQR